MGYYLDWATDGADWPNREASRFVEAAGLRWHVQVMGAGPVLLLLHGTGASTHSWRDVMPKLAAIHRGGARSSRPCLHQPGGQAEPVAARHGGRRRGAAPRTELSPGARRRPLGRCRRCWCAWRSSGSSRPPDRQLQRRLLPRQRCRGPVLLAARQGRGRRLADAEDVCPHGGPHGRGAPAARHGLAHRRGGHRPLPAPVLQRGPHRGHAGHDGGLGPALGAAGPAQPAPSRSISSRASKDRTIPPANAGEGREARAPAHHHRHAGPGPPRP